MIKADLSNSAIANPITCVTAVCLAVRRIYALTCQHSRKNLFTSAVSHHSRFTRRRASRGFPAADLGVV